MKDTFVLSYVNIITTLYIQIDIAKSIHVCFSSKEGRSDTALYLVITIVYKRYGNDV